MGDNNQLSFPEEDEDLEALRLAALQSLKKKSNNETQPMGNFGAGNEKLTHFNGSPRGKHKRGKFPRPQQGRQPRNGQFNGWSRNSNLIAVPMVTETENIPEIKKPLLPNDVPKLVLPQDRYCKLEKTPEKTDSLTSKFDRYDNSGSDSDSEEEEDSKSEPEEKPELKRSNSLEALMAELENEIQGVTSKPPEDKPKPKQVKKKRKVSTATPPTPPTPPETEKPVLVLKENLKPEPEPPIKKPLQNRENFPRQRKWQAKPPRRHYVPPPPIVHRPPIAPPPEIIPAQVVAFAPPPVQTFPPYNPIGFDNGVVYVPPVVFDAPPPPPHLPPIHVAPPVFDRALSPLTINSDTFGTTSILAPLSPRSAAFVMENRAIIEKRKRRSYSRSPSPPRFRRSKSPKRLSISPKRRSLSPSPVRKVLPLRASSPKKPPVHNRLGLKPPEKTEADDDKTKTERSPIKKEEKKEVLDPVLEARRRKFERNEIVMREGVIRLKKSEEEPKKDEQVDADFDEDALLEGEGDVEPDADDAILLDPGTLFSDEESDSDNEGRFKTKQETNQKVPVLPFTKLMNGAKNEVKHDLNAERKRKGRSRSPAKKAAPRASKKADKVKQPMGFSSDRKIEIKIRNPAKYERTEGAKSGERKVEVAKKVEEGEIESAGETAEDAPNSNLSEGDLRAQLSRKRAERQKHPLPDVVPSRLLQNALQGVGFRKGKKTKTSKDEANDGKLPIHLRLGAANGSEVFGKKSRKHSNKNKGSQEQDIISPKKRLFT